MARILAFAIAAAPLCAVAARPMITDDARIVDPNACQVESWIRTNRDTREYWALPACNPTGNLELTFGGARTSGEVTGLTDNIVQAKTILRPLDAESWGLGIAAGLARHPRRDRASRWPGDAYFYVPVSIAVAGEAWVAHFNAGMVHRRDLGENVATWGFGNEIRLNPSLYFIPEIFRSERGRPFYQAGFRYWLVKDRVQMDATYGNRTGSSSSERWYSIGVRLLSPPFLP